MLSIVMESVMILAVLLFLFMYEPKITLIAMLSVGISGLVLIRMMKKYEQAYGKQAQQSRKELVQRVSEGLGGVKEIKVLNRQQYFISRLYDTLERLKKAETYNETTRESFRPIIELVAVLGLLALTLILYLEGRALNEIAPVLTIFGASTFQMLPSFAKLTNQYSKLDYHSHAIIPVHEDLMRSTDHLVNKTPEKSTDKLLLTDNLTIKNVTFSYPNNLKSKILDNVTLTLNRGSAIGIIGKSGAGKTTLIDLILGLFEPDSGDILVDGKSIYENLSGWQENIGYIPQTIFLADDTVRKNIAFGLNDEEIDNEQLLSAIKAAQLQEVVNALPHGLDSNIGERGVRLSGGQRQRIGIARALYQNPEVLIMDEATSSLDNETEDYVIRSIERLKGDRTIIIIAHRLSTVESCDVLFRINNGRVSEASKTEAS